MDSKKNISELYKKMSYRNYMNKNSEKYVWLSEMEWMDYENVIKNERVEDINIISFAYNGRGDRWIFIKNDQGEPYIGFYCLEDIYGIYYAKNLEDAIMRNIIEFISGAWFYVDKTEAESYQMSGDELKKWLKNWIEAFEGLLKKEYIVLLKEFHNMELKFCKGDYCSWYALLNIEEADNIIEKYLKFELMDEEFEIESEYIDKI